MSKRRFGLFLIFEGYRLTKLSITLRESVNIFGTIRTRQAFPLHLVAGGRGIGAISKTANGATTVVYPIYDAHGNMVADISKNGSSFGVNDVRSYDAWGNIRQGAQTGDPKGRYCASLGHKMDDESGLIYMRARYYEPTSGRFISQDPQMQGGNWFVYATSDPISGEDYSGTIDYVDLYHVFYQASDDFLAGLREAIAEYKSSGDADVISDYIINYWNTESMNFAVGGDYRVQR